MPRSIKALLRVLAAFGILTWLISGAAPLPTHAQSQSNGAGGLPAPVLPATPPGSDTSPQLPDLPPLLEQPATHAAPVTSSSLVVSGTNTFVVNITADTTCPASGTGGVSLRCAIIMANNSPATVKKIIDFDIPGTDPGCTTQVINAVNTVVCKISPATDLPQVNAPLTTINGYTQTGALANTSATADNATITIQLDGSSDPTSQDALALAGNSALLEGLSITGFPLYGVLSTGTGNTMSGNLIGLSPTGGYSNMAIGLLLESGSTQVVGGTTPAARNAVDASAPVELSATSSDQVKGNLIGTNLAGTAEGQPAPGAGVYILTSGNSNTIGGTTDSARNVIASSNIGIELLEQGTSGTGTNGNIVEGNYIGIDVTGTALTSGALKYGIYDAGTGPNTIGGTVAGAGNVIGGASTTGVFLGYKNQKCSGVRVQGNKIGTNAAGTAALTNSHGIVVDGCTSISIGGAAAGSGNLISGNSGTGVVVQSTNASYPTAFITIAGNTIGTNASGTAALGNGNDGIDLLGATGTTIGGSLAGSGNVISGNTAEGVLLNTANNTVYGNLIGTNAAGTAAIPNLDGVKVTAIGNIIGGTGSLSNLISGNTSNGVYFLGVGGRIQGNRIGTNLAGTGSVPNQYGVYSQGTPSTTVIIGGTAAGQGNLISGNHAVSGVGGYGIELYKASNVVIQGNTIGLTATATALANAGGGIYCFNSTSNVLIGGTAVGAANTIADNAVSGIQVGSSASDTTTKGIAVRENSLFGNAGPGILIASQTVSNCGTAVVGADPNDNIPCPSITSATTTLLSGHGLAGAVLEVFVALSGTGDSGHGEGQTFVGVATVNLSGNWSLTVAAGVLTSGQAVTATQSKTLTTFQETSEFAANATVS